MARKYLHTLIADKMKTLGLSQTALARESGVSRSHIVNVLGRRYGLSQETAEKLAGALKMSPKTLMNAPVRRDGWRNRASWGRTTRRT